MTAAQAEKEIRARARAVYLGDHLTLARVLGHSKMLLPTTDVGFASHVMLDGFWEIWLTLFFARLVMPGMTVIDVGANFGYYTLLFGHAVGPSGHVIAIEPVPATAAILARTIELNGLTGRTQLVAAAAWDRPDIEVHARQARRAEKRCRDRAGAAGLDRRADDHGGCAHARAHAARSRQDRCRGRGGRDYC